MNKGFFRYPHTPHIVWLGENAPRDDKILDESEVCELLSGVVVVEEKLDGANLGLSVGKTDGKIKPQNRGDYLRPPYRGQFSRLNQWLEWRQDSLAQALGPDLIAFGEWCAARHTLTYEDLPDWWILFDIYDRSVGKFWSGGRRDKFADELQLSVVPELYRGRATLQELLVMSERKSSRFGAPEIEGLIVRRETNEWLEARAKLVRRNFVQSISDHWRVGQIQWNRTRVCRS